MIIYTGLHKTFLIAIMTVFRTKRYMQHLRSLFWLLLTILSILSLTAFPTISVGSQIRFGPPCYECFTSKCSFYQKLVFYLTVNKTKCIWNIYMYIIYIYILHIYIYINIYIYIYIYSGAFSGSIITGQHLKERGKQKSL